MNFRRHFLVYASSAIALLVCNVAFAQIQEALPNPLRERVTRSELTAIAHSSDSLAYWSKSPREQADHRARARAARLRLQEGDIRVGDRIIVEVVNFEGLNDTATVRDGQLIEIENFPAIPLRGVLRTELDAHLTEQIAKYYRNPQVRATAMLRLAVSGGVGNPDFHFARTDAILSDVISAAGGFTTDASTKKIRIQRGGEVRWNSHQTAVALSDGWTLDSLQLISGDEIFVGRRGATGLTSTLAIVSSITTVIFAVFSLTRSR